MLIYVAGPYTAPTAEGVENNVKTAAWVAGLLWKMGHSVICPHANTHLPAKYAHLKPEQWIAGDLQQLAVCDAIVMLPGWRQSKGAMQEHAFAVVQKIPVYELKEGAPLPPLHPTEVRAPLQAKAFRAAIGNMYRTHLRKNADYSPANILATGQIGLVTRLWDKVARLLNLSGFRITVLEGTFEAPREPQNEAIDDTLDDAAVYAIIGKLLRQGAWGR
jgi:hypothetical protein